MPRFAKLRGQELTCMLHVVHKLTSLANRQTDRQRQSVTYELVHILILRQVHATWRDIDHMPLHTSVQSRQQHVR